MKTIFRRLRGILGMGVTWAVVWACAGALIGIVQRYWLPRSYPQLPPGALDGIILANGISWGTYGFALGSLFACVLAIAERRRALEQLTIWRIAVWGALAGALLPVTFMVGLKLATGWGVTNGLLSTLLSVSLGAGSAAASLALARSAPANRELASPTVPDLPRIG
jgi:hypothetical protein